MGTFRAIGVRLAAVGMLVAPLAAHGRLYLEGPETWVPGEIITILLKADTDTDVQTFAFGIDPETGEAIYSRYADVLELYNRPATTVPDIIKTADGIGDCGFTDASCSYFYIPALTIPAGTVVTWEFLVKEGAPTGPVQFGFDLGAEADADMDFNAEPIPWMSQKQFIVAIPESSTWVLLMLGLAAVSLRTLHRRTRW